jgi:hypothetical protein
MDFKFMAHVGDIKWGQVPCYESSFRDVAEMFTHPSNAINYDPKDCFFVPGDNEFQDCQSKTDAWGWWMQCEAQPTYPGNLCLDRASSLTQHSPQYRFWQWRRPKYTWILHVIGS